MPSVPSRPVAGAFALPSAFHSFWRPRLAFLFAVFAATLAACGGGGGSSTSSSTTTNFPAAAQATWTWWGGSQLGDAASVYGTEGVAAASSMPGGRTFAASWTDSNGNFWLFGGQSGGQSAGTSSTALLNDLWMYNPSTKEWTWEGGSDTGGASGVYGTEGSAAPGNMPGARDGAVTWVDHNGDFWLFGGNGYDAAGTSGNLNDLWMYSPSTKEWTWEGGSNTVNASGVYGSEGAAAATNMPGARASAVSWVDHNGNLWLFGGDGVDSAGTNGALNDLWMYNPSTKEWTWVGGSSTANAIGVYASSGTANAGNVPGARGSAVGWVDANGNLWLFGGYGYDSAGTDGYLNDLWMYNIATGQWTWECGNDTANANGGNSTNGQIYNGETPGGLMDPVAWTDAQGNLWMFGGYGVSAGDVGYFDQVWMYDPNSAIHGWAYEGGYASQNYGPGYPAQGTPVPSFDPYCPVTRDGASGWVDSSGNLWMFGGTGSYAGANDLSDLWDYTPLPGQP